MDRILLMQTMESIGLTEVEAESSRDRHGANEVTAKATPEWRKVCADHGLYGRSYLIFASSGHDCERFCARRCSEDTPIGLFC